MLNIGAGEMVFILVLALLILGPKKLPELARGIGKFMREFRRQTDEVRSVVEKEFYKMDQEVAAESQPAITSGAANGVANVAALPEKTVEAAATPAAPEVAAAPAVPEVKDPYDPDVQQHDQKHSDPDPAADHQTNLIHSDPPPDAPKA